ncbi:MAG: hypothetical protein II581_08155 [Oscillospiraceae bacterium]|nr:hypothetical protein [Oscillospiraceae bacterium]
MKDYAPLRIAGDQSFYFLLVCLFAAPYAQPWLFAAMLAACLIFGFLAVRSDAAFVRVLCTLPPAALLLLADGLVPMLLLVPAWLYFMLLYATGNTSVEYHVYRGAFIFMLAFSVFGFLLSAGLSFFRNDDFRSEVVFLVALLLFGFLTMQTIRMSVQTNLRWKLQSLAAIAVPAAGFAGLFSLIYLTAGYAKPVVEILAMPFALLLRLLNALFSKLFDDSLAPTDVFPTVESVEVETQIVTRGTFPESKGVGHGWNLDMNWAAILTVALSLVMIVVLTVLLVRYLRGGRRQKDAAQLAAVQEETYHRTRRRRRKDTETSDDLLIRSIYRQYLIFLSQHGQTIYKDNTSLEILNDANKTLVTQSDRSLRALYLIARYGDAKKLTREDAQQAQACLEAIEKAYAEAAAEQTKADGSAADKTERSII